MRMLSVFVIVFDIRWNWNFLVRGLAIIKLIDWFNKFINQYLESVSIKLSSFLVKRWFWVGNVGMVVIIPCYCLLMVIINRDAVSGGYLATSVDTFFFLWIYCSRNWGWVFLCFYLWYIVSSLLWQNQLLINACWTEFLEAEGILIWRTFCSKTQSLISWWRLYGLCLVVLQFWFLN